jgi:hypothetical protein
MPQERGKVRSEKANTNNLRRIYLYCKAAYARKVASDATFATPNPQTPKPILNF